MFYLRINFFSNENENAAVNFEKLLHIYFFKSFFKKIILSGLQKVFLINQGLSCGKLDVC